MVHHIPHAISVESAASLLNLYRNSTNCLTESGVERDRFYSSTASHGKFLIAEFSHSEFAPWWDIISPQLPGSYELVFARVLKYNPSCYVQPHLDGVLSSASTSDTSVIIQLNDSSQYEGGQMMIDHQIPPQMAVGDLVMYSYSTLHAVSEITRGLRYVCNLRLKSLNG